MPALHQTYHLPESEPQACTDFLTSSQAGALNVMASKTEDLPSVLLGCVYTLTSLEERHTSQTLAQADFHI